MVLPHPADAEKSDSDFISHILPRYFIIYFILSFHLQIIIFQFIIILLYIWKLADVKIMFRWYLYHVEILILPFLVVEWYVL